jgi:hypothetical protein
MLWRCLSICLSGRTALCASAHHDCQVGKTMPQAEVLQWLLSRYAPDSVTLQYWKHGTPSDATGVTQGQDPLSLAIPCLECSWGRDVSP